MMTLPSSRNSRMTRNRLSISGGERAGRLIERDNLGVTRQRFGNLHHLPLTNGEIFQRRLRVDIQTQMLQLQAGLIVEQRAIDDAASVRQLTEIDIFGDGHLRDQMQLPGR